MTMPKIIPEIARRRLLQAGGLLMVSSLLPAPLRALAADHHAALASIPLDRVSSFIAISADGNVTAFNGHVDLGTGVRTSLAQIVADELCVNVEDVTMILGDTQLTPDQGPTIASATLQVTSIPLRQAAAQIRHLLLDLDSRVFKLPVEQLVAQQGWVAIAARPEQRLSYADLVRGQDLHLPLDPHVALLPRSAGQYVGKAVARVDIPDKVCGSLTYVHDFRLPDM